MRVIVTGAAGFVGRHLTRRLLGEGISVIATTRDAGRARNTLGSGVDLCAADLRRDEPRAFLSAFRGEVDAIIHLAASLDYFGRWRELLAMNVESTRRLMGWAMDSGVSRFLFASSIEAVGPLQSDDVPGDEESPTRPVSTYGRSKALAERQVLGLQGNADLDPVVLRLGNVYGPGGPAFLLPIANAVAKGGVLARYLPSVSHHTLAAVHVDDACEALLYALRSDRRGVFTIAGDRAVPVSEIFQRVADTLGGRVPEGQPVSAAEVALALRGLRHRVRRRADLLDYLTAGGRRRTQREFSIARAQRELAYGPRVAPETGFTDVLRWAGEQGLLPAMRS